MLFGLLDPNPAQRRADRGSLREFLLGGQKEWSKDGGVVVQETPPDPAFGVGQIPSQPCTSLELQRVVGT